MLEDLEAHGILHTLLQPEETRKSLEISRSQERVNGWEPAPPKQAPSEQHAAAANGQSGDDDSENIGAGQEKVCLQACTGDTMCLTQHSRAGCLLALTEWRKQHDLWVSDVLLCPSTLMSCASALLGTAITT